MGSDNNWSRSILNIVYIKIVSNHDSLLPLQPSTHHAHWLTTEALDQVHGHQQARVRPVQVQPTACPAQGNARQAPSGYSYLYAECPDNKKKNMKKFEDDDDWNIGMEGSSVVDYDSGDHP